VRSGSGPSWGHDHNLSGQSWRLALLVNAPIGLAVLALVGGWWRQAAGGG
jgi:hypothetical protein